MNSEMTRQISASVYSVGALNPNLRVFDIVMRTDYGTSYNAYLIRGEKTALIETCHGSFFEEFMENIRAVCDPGEIDYIILNHTEPDHSGALRRLLEEAPQAEIIASRAAAIYLRAITNLPDLKVRAVGDGETLDLGGGKTLRFINAPFLHWPDSMFTWFEAEGVLFSCDFLGSHYCEPRMIDTAITYPDAYQSALKNYFDAIFGPFKPYVLKGLDKIADLDIAVCANSHGPVLTKGGRLQNALDCYRAWAQPQQNDVCTIPIFYCTAYGHTARTAEAIREGILSVKPEAKVELFNIIDEDMADLGARLMGSDAFLVGSPTINKDAVPPVWQLLSHVDAINIQKRPAAAFGSYGWSGEAVPALCTRLSQLKCRVFGEGLKVNFVPSEKELAAAVSFGKEFAESL